MYYHLLNGFWHILICIPFCASGESIKECPTLPPYYNPQCADTCSADQQCDYGEKCCNYKGQHICLARTQHLNQTCLYRNNLYNELTSAKVGQTFVDRFENLCRCRASHHGKEGIVDCSVMRCNLHSTNCKGNTSVSGWNAENHNQNNNSGK